MKNHTSQKDLILKVLRDKGFVTRNMAIRGEYGQYITRLSSIILTLRAQGMNIETKETKNPTETTYTLLDKPKEIKTYFVNGTKVAPDKYIW